MSMRKPWESVIGWHVPWASNNMLLRENQLRDFPVDVFVQDLTPRCVSQQQSSPASGALAPRVR